MGEYEGIETAHKVACFIDENLGIAGELLNHFGGDLDDAGKVMEENYCGCYQSLTDYAEELTGETVQIPESLAFISTMKRWGAIWN